MEVWESTAREAIRDLVARYNANGDSGRFDAVLSLFADDAVMQIDSADGPRSFTGLAEIATIFTGTRDLWATAGSADGPSPGLTSGGAPQYVRHHVSTLQIDVDDPSHASGYAYFIVVMRHGLDHWGRYFDRYEIRDGQWVFTFRRVVTDHRQDWPEAAAAPARWGPASTIGADGDGGEHFEYRTMNEPGVDD